MKKALLLALLVACPAFAQTKGTCNIAVLGGGAMKVGQCTPTRTPPFSLSIPDAINGACTVDVGVDGAMRFDQCTPTRTLPFSFSIPDAANSACTVDVTTDGFPKIGRCAPARTPPFVLDVAATLVEPQPTQAPPNARPPQPPITSTWIFWLVLLGAVSLVGYLLRNQAKDFYARFKAQIKALWKRVKEFYGNVRKEMKSVSSPSRQQVLGTTTVVIITVFIFAAYFGIIDFIINKSVTALFGYFRTH